MTLRHLALISRDGLFLKDGRGWSTSAVGRASVLSWPSPSTIRGALRTRVGLELEAAQGRPLTPSDWLSQTQDVCLSAMLAMRKPLLEASWRPEHLIWPKPQDALYVEDAQLLRLDPRQPNPRVGTLSESDEPGLEQLWRPSPPSKAKPVAGPSWWSHQRMVSWLCDEQPAAALSAQERALSVSTQQRVHVTLNPSTRTAQEHMLYSTTLIETLTRGAGAKPSQAFEWALGLRLQLPQAAAQAALEGASVTPGGKRRLGRLAALDAAIFEPPKALLRAFEQHRPLGLRLVLASPARFERGWCPDGFAWDGQRWRGSLLGRQAILRAALVGRPTHISGWDMAHKQPKPTLRLASAGSVYAFTRADGQPWSAQDAADLWLASLGQSPEDGFGVVIPGLWRPLAMEG